MRRVRANFSALLFFVVIFLGPASRPAIAEDGLFQQQTLTGDWAGMRTSLKDAGIDLNANDTSEVLANPAGGIKQTTIYQGLLTMTLNLDLEKLVSWPGATIYGEAYQINGRGLSRSALGNLLVVSNIEALPGARLNDFWFQQELFDRQLSLRIGQIAIDDPNEFYYSQYSANFINSTFGCPDLLSTDLPSGGPCYPFAVPGVRLRVAPISGLTWSTALFNGNPAPPGPGDPQVRNSGGTNFLIGEGGALVLTELAYSFDTKPDLPNPLSDLKVGA